VEAVADATFAVPRGSITAIVGPNGAGKSTLFALALGFIAPTRGWIRVAGDDPRDYVRRRGAGYLPDRFVLPAEWPVRRLLHALARMEHGGASGAVGDAIERFGLQSVADRPAGALSHGTLQRVGLAQAMLVHHELVILDEPVQGLDPQWRVRLRDMLDELRRQGSTVMIASHDLTEVERIADLVVLLDRGRVRETFPLAAETGAGRSWRIRLAASFDGVRDAFPDARALENGIEFLVAARDELELTSRLAALIASGAVLSAVEPSTEALETRVRRALEDRGG